LPLNETPQENVDVVVVGAGFAGLATGALLAHRGIRVLVLERRPVLGGRALVVKQNGFTLNYGLHYVVGGHASPHYRILKQIGKLDTAPMKPVDTRKLHRWRYGQLHQVPTSPVDMLATRLLTPRGKLELAKALAAIMTANPEGLWHTPVGRWLDGVTTEPSLRNFLLDLCSPLTFEPQPELLSAAHFVLTVRPLLMPKGPLGLYPVGGWITLFEALAACIQEGGGEVRTKAPAERLEIADGRVAGVWSQGAQVKCRAAVLAIPPNELAELLKDTPVPGLETERLKRIRPTMGVAVDLGVMDLQNEKIGTIELPEFAATLGIHNLFEPSLAPPGGHLFQFLRFLTPEQMQDAQEVDWSEELIVSFLETIWPDIRQKIVVRRTLVRPVLTAASHRYDQPRPTLLPIAILEIKGLFLAGDATASPGELSNSAGNSAIDCAQRVSTLLEAM
jgi:phytoene dehydrogenase-like protein